MNNLAGNISKIELINQELNSILEILSHTSISTEKTLTTNSGRTYKVANVIEHNENWIVTDLISKGTFICNSCNNAMYNGDAWLQFIHQASVVRMHSSLIHIFEKHPEHVLQETLEKVAAVFIN